GSRAGRAGVAFADEDVAVRCHEDVVGLEQVAGFACAAWLTDGHQVLAGRAELVHLVSERLGCGAVGGGVVTAVGDPYVALEVDMDAVRPHDHALAEADNHVAVAVELHDRIQYALDAGADVAAAALGNPDADAVRVDVHGAGG